jgi:hypothetical protein
VLANRIYGNADKDGSVIAILERGTPQLAVQGDSNARFDPLRMTWLGSPTPTTLTCSGSMRRYR